MNNLFNANGVIRQRADQLSAAGDRFATGTGDGEQAIQCHRAAVALYRLTSERRHPDLVDPLSRLAVCCERAGYFSQAEDSILEIIGIIAAVDANDTRLPSWLNALARARAGQGKIGAGLQAANDALDLNERHFGQVSRQVADTMSILGDLYLRKGALDEAERCLSLAGDIYVGTVRADAPELVSALERLDDIKTLKRNSRKLKL